MADEKPVEEKPAEQPVVAAVVEAPVVAEVAEAPVAEEKPAEAVVEKTPSLLETAVAPGTEEKPAEEKPAEEKPAAEKPVEEKPAEEKPAEPKPEEKPAEVEKPAEAKAEEKPAEEPAKPEPVEYAYTVPEVLKMDDTLKGEFHGAMDEFRANPKEGAQKLLDLHVARMQDYDKSLRQQQVDSWNTTKENWKKEVLADEQIGGAGHQTAMQAIATVRDRFVSDHPRGSEGWKKDVAGFVHMLDSTGVGNHPYFLRFLHRQSRFINEPAVPMITDVKPAPDAGRRKGGDVLYDNDRSPNGRQ